MHGAPNAVRFSVSRVTAWAPGMETDAAWQEWARGERTLGREGAPRLEQMPAMLRRHAGQLGRMACDVAYRALDGATGIPIVFCSRYGEVGRSVDLLSALARGTALSPTSFGLSVHNAVAGLFAMSRHDRANCVALAGGDESAEYGVVETCGLFSEGIERVLLVVGDSPLPAVYEQFADVDAAAFAWACLVEPPRADVISLSWGAAPRRERGPVGPPASMGALRFLQADAHEHIHDAGDLRWRWSRHA
ncbi:MAG: beta-ketoacyl synthase chain length factor [Gemmatimonadaceae bacterium]